MDEDEVESNENLIQQKKEKYYKLVKENQELIDQISKVIYKLKLTPVFNLYLKYL